MTEAAQDLQTPLLPRPPWQQSQPSLTRYNKFTLELLTASGERKYSSVLLPFSTRPTTTSLVMSWPWLLDVDQIIYQDETFKYRGVLLLPALIRTVCAVQNDARYCHFLLCDWLWKPQNHQPAIIKIKNQGTSHCRENITLLNKRQQSSKPNKWCNPINNLLALLARYILTSLWDRYIVHRISYLRLPHNFNQIVW